ncbi:27738_t:CDS:2, partial [Dentiscutata erythropus]
RFIGTLPSALFAYRTIKHNTTQHEPFYLTYGQEVILPVEFQVETHVFQEKGKDEQETLLRRIYQLIGKLQEDQDSTKIASIYQGLSKTYYKCWPTRHSRSFWLFLERSICKKIKHFENEDKTIYRSLEWCYQLEVGSRKGPEVFRVAKRTFELYNAQEIWNLYQAEKINYRVLARMYDSDFEMLKQEAYRAYLEEASNSTILN